MKCQIDLVPWYIIFSLQKYLHPTNTYLKPKMARCHTNIYDIWFGITLYFSKRKGFFMNKSIATIHKIGYYLSNYVTRQNHRNWIHGVVKNNQLKLQLKYRTIQFLTKFLFEEKGHENQMQMIYTRDSIQDKKRYKTNRLIIGFSAPDLYWVCTAPWFRKKTWLLTILHFKMR